MLSDLYKFIAEYFVFKTSTLLYFLSAIGT